MSASSHASWQHAHVGDRVRVVVEPAVDRHALAAHGDEVEVVGADLHLHDPRDRAHSRALIAATRLVAALDEHDAERGIVLVEQVSEHREVARLEDAQHERGVREQHRSQREHRNGVHRSSQPPPREPGAAPMPAQGVRGQR